MVIFWDDVGSTLNNEENVYVHRIHNFAEAVGETYEKICDKAMDFYRENKKGDLKLAKNIRLVLLQIDHWELPIDCSNTEY